MKKHEILEKNVGLLSLFMILAVSIGGLTQIVPLFFQDVVNEPVEGMKPYTALQLEGRDLYIREGCVGCHSQMVRPFRAETERYGHYSVAGESVYDHPFLWGSKRTGPDLARVGGRYPMTGTVRTCTTRATWCRSPRCRPTPGSSSTSSTAGTPPRRCKPCAASACLTPRKTSPVRRTRSRAKPKWTPWWLPAGPWHRAAEQALS